MAGCDCKDGQRGIMGLPGIQGEPGVPGATGGQGAQGLQGTTGYKGSKGDTGLQGPIGTLGLKGRTGHAGIPGADGAPGIPGLAGAAGPAGENGKDGEKGAQGITGTQGPQGAQGIQGIDGRYIIGSYISLTGIGNSSAIGDETLLFSQSLVGNTLSNNGDEIELLLDTEYFANDIVNIIFDMNLANRYTYSYVNVDNDIRSIKIVITRIDSTHQMWSIQDATKNLVSLGISITTLATFTTGYDLTTPMSFEILADNLVVGADQVILKKCSMYLNKLQ